MKIVSVVGARPNFMKIAPFIGAINAYNASSKEAIQHVLVHTGQHYDDRMSKAFFEALSIPQADINMGIGSGSHAEQVGHTMIAIENVLLTEQPDWVVVLGDVNATLACSVTAKKLHMKVCHIEAGLRSGDVRMPEEINRLVTDRLSDLLLVPDHLSKQNLLDEGCAEQSIVMVGNIMIDTLDANFSKAKGLLLEDIIRDNCHDDDAKNVECHDGKFAVVTLHRPSNVDDELHLSQIIDFLKDSVATMMNVVWPIHPRTEKCLKRFGLWNSLRNIPNLQLLYPLGYHEMLRLNIGAQLMLTDSGGLQEECTVLGTRCITMRWNTERPITLQKNGGASVLVGNDIDLLQQAFNTMLAEEVLPTRPEMWDGKTAMRCVEAIVNW